jgi:hypothetical protein
VSAVAPAVGRHRALRRTLAVSTRKLAFTLGFTAVSSLVGGCSYGDMVVHPKNGKLYIQRNDLFLFGGLRRLYECTPDGKGKVACVRLDGRP